MNETTNWLKTNADYLSFNRIEKDNDIPQGTLRKVVKGERPLPAKWMPAITALQKRMCGGSK